MTRKHTPEQERRIREAALDETIEDTFPASDALSSDPNPENEDALRRPRVSEDERPAVDADVRRQ